MSSTEESYFSGILAAQKRQRKSMLNGDFIAFSLKAGGYIFGRVIDDEAIHGAAVLTAIYDVHAPTDKLAPVRDLLSADRLLLPPVNIGWLAIRSGLSRTIGHDEIRNTDIPQPVCMFGWNKGEDCGTPVIYVPADRSYHMEDRSLDARNIVDQNNQLVDFPQPPYGRGSGSVFSDATVARLIDETVAATGLIEVQ